MAWQGAPSDKSALSSKCMIFSSANRLTQNGQNTNTCIYVFRPVRHRKSEDPIEQNQVSSRYYLDRWYVESSRSDCYQLVVPFMCMSIHQARPGAVELLLKSRER